jgi:phosphoribosylformylglycinamidine cyclo-ligase
LHSNGFSLVRKVVEAAGLNFSDKAPFGDDASLGAALLTPTRIYVKSCLAAVRTGKVKALAHITGGGLLDNVPRVLPDGIGADLDANAWRAPEVFDWLAETGAIAGSEMAHAFNCGIGMTVITAPGDATEIAALLTAEGENVTQIGTVVARGPGEPEIKISGLEEKWRG